MYFIIFSHRASPRHASVSVTVTHLTENVIDVQFADETSTIEGLMLEILQYTTACLNSTIKYQAGIFITRADDHDEEGIARVPLSSE